MSDEEKKRGVVVDHHHHEDHPPPPPQPQYGTFQGVANYPPPPQHPAIGFPQPVPPPGATAEPYAHGYQTVPGYADAEVEGRPVTHRRLPCCGCGVGWFLFIIGFFLGAIPCIKLFNINHCDNTFTDASFYYFTRACISIQHLSGNLQFMAILATIAIILGVTKGVDACCAQNHGCL
ncbi:60S RIBOSOMAL PROTEIN L18A-LIKE, partial [Salix purpurea]